MEKKDILPLLITAKRKERGKPSSVSKILPVKKRRAGGSWIEYP